MAVSNQEYKTKSVQMTVEVPTSEEETAFVLYKFEQDEETEGDFSIEAIVKESLEGDVPWVQVETETPPRYKVAFNMDRAILVEPDSPVKMLWEAINEHYTAHPEHGFNCSCMDNHIATLRKWFKMWPEENASQLADVDQKAARAWQRVVGIASRW